MRRREASRRPAAQLFRNFYFPSRPAPDFGRGLESSLCAGANRDLLPRGKKVRQDAVDLHSNRA
jgi:hypothetical protein